MNFPHFQGSEEEEVLGPKITYKPQKERPNKEIKVSPQSFTIIFLLQVLSWYSLRLLDVSRFIGSFSVVLCFSCRWRWPVQCSSFASSPWRSLTMRRRVRGSFQSRFSPLTSSHRTNSCWTPMCLCDIDPPSQAILQLVSGPRKDSSGFADRNSKALLFC